MKNKISIDTDYWWGMVCHHSLGHFFWSYFKSMLIEELQELAKEYGDKKIISASVDNDEIRNTLPFYVSELKESAKEKKKRCMSKFYKNCTDLRSCRTTNDYSRLEQVNNEYPKIHDDLANAWQEYKIISAISRIIWFISKPPFDMQTEVIRYVYHDEGCKEKKRKLGEWLTKNVADKEKLSTGKSI